jgi:hypothetical protein
VSSRINFGHCIGCDQPIRPPYLSFTVRHVHGNGDSITEWDEIDVCDPCARKLPARDLYRRASGDESGA